MPKLLDWLKTYDELHPDAREQERLLRKKKPEMDAKIVCQHCGERGAVVSRATTAKDRVHWLGLSSSLSMAREVTELHCNACGMTWRVS